MIKKIIIKDDFNFFFILLQENISLSSDILEMIDAYPRTRSIFFITTDIEKVLNSIVNCF